MSLTFFRCAGGMEFHMRRDRSSEALVLGTASCRFSGQMGTCTSSSAITKAAEQEKEVSWRKRTHVACFY